MARPLIGISGRRWPASALGAHVPVAMSTIEFDLHFTDYPRSIALAGGLPVELTRDADPEEMVEHLDGLVLSGGADVDPANRLSPIATPGRSDCSPRPSAKVSRCSPSVVDCSW